MKLSISKNVKLDREYTNHSICATIITTLDNAGFEACHIIQLSSHKSESTVKEYAKKCSDTKRKEMFQSLSDAMDVPAKKVKTSAPPVIPPQPSVQDIKDNLPNFNIEPMEDFDTIDDSILQEIMQNFEDNQQIQPIDQNVKASTTSALAVKLPTTAA